MPWWKHVFNIAMYSIMIISFHYTYHYFNQNNELFTIKGLSSYLLAMLTYFSVNALLVAFYFVLMRKETFSSFTKIIVKEGVPGYIGTLLLSLVLIILITSKSMFGLILFMCIATLLSIAFKQNFDTYQRAYNKANTDYLTGLNNHGFFKDQLEEYIKAINNSKQTLCVALLDIDNFKKYNDLYGHMKGDELLKFFGSLLQSECSKQNYFVARYGGEEFSILMPNTFKEDAYLYMERLRKKVNDTYFDGVEYLPYKCLSFSAGIAEYTIDTYDSQELLSKADQAMYYAKAQGRNLIHVFDEQSSYFASQSVTLEKELYEIEQQLNIFLSKDVYTYRHSKRVFKYAVDFSNKLQLNETERKTLILGALIHDIGKLEIPRDIINKTSKLDSHEWEIMKKHVTWGKEIISTNKKLIDLIPLVELHHERFDGKGYPYGLQGDAIPKLARILCIIDSFDAMTTERPYQATKTFAEAIVELRACADKQFDGRYVEPFIEMIEEKYMSLQDNDCIGTVVH
ncbi:diguanylate cyclase [Ectobacillus sp. JY-23]|uniref:diguanylate cyclase n=1 Tax=Ectobacillus sp. JY-23 TaxID=2933872 RepID=UPI001FF48881|nr:HD-GYP domain-containing protein [Ectobacillus sp. JY-23]UOY91591.1 diguanylate cyclase [Ectobacillus sp. JY-23]